MRSFLLNVLVLLYLSLTVCVGQGIAPGGNYVVTNTLQKAGVTAVSQIAALPVQDVKKDIVYVDGFGRPIQSVGVQASATGKDVVVIMEYDAFGRQAKNYLPYTGGTTGAFKTNAKNELNAFYGVNAAANKVATTAYPYSESVFEASPLDKLLETGNAGEDWQVSTGHTKKILTRPCAVSEIRVWDYNFTSGVISSPGFYAEGDALAQETRDEHGALTIKFSDKKGLHIATKSQVTATEFAWTYNVYDAFGNLRAVIQPEGYKELLAANTWTLSATFLDKWCFVYKYDEWQRPSEKKVPATGAVYIVYNKKNQPVLEQDGELRKTNRWIFSKYDALGRKVLSGIYTHTSAVTQLQMQQLAAGNAGFESPTAQNYSTQQGYTVANAFPALTTTNSEILSVKYYDDYDFDRNTITPGSGFIALGRATEPVQGYSAMGLPTGSKEKILGDTRFLQNALLYDNRDRVIQTHSESARSGLNIVTTRPNFLGQPLETVSYYGGSSETYIKQQYTYDQAGRLKKITHQAERDETFFPTITLATYAYNEAGQQIEKKLHSTDAVNFLQTVDYRYNIRGWLTSINDAQLSDVNDLFGMEFKYNTGLQSPHSVSPLFNGNIAEALWKDAYSNKQQVYAYSYDQYGRLLSAKYASKSGTTWIEQGGYNESSRYDLNGNILGLTRYLWPAGATTPQLGDDLRYSYTGNQLKKVEDSAFTAGSYASAGFVNGTNQADEYVYNANGCITEDKNKGITSVTYNVLNLPVEIVIAGKGKIVYQYDASGKKLSKQMVPLTGATVITHYSDGAEFIDNVLKWIYTAEGRLVWQSVVATSYEYSLKDHLGNVRVNFDRNPATGKARIIQKTDYYAYGMTMPGNFISGQKNKYQYNNKELQDELGLEWYDYGARMYDAQLSKWHAIDPKSEEFYSYSPYNYALLNPMRFIDPDGNAPVDDYVFDEKGRFQRVDRNDQPDKIVVENSQTKQKDYYEFNDPGDAQKIESGEINKLVIVSPQMIRQTVQEALEGREGRWRFAARESRAYGKIDFVSHTDYLEANALHVVAGNGSSMNGVAYNDYDMGNFLWGQATRQMHYSQFTALMAAQANNMFNGRRDNPTISVGLLDSIYDQQAISNGHQWPNKPAPQCTQEGVRKPFTWIH